MLPYDNNPCATQTLKTSCNPKDKFKGSIWVSAHLKKAPDGKSQECHIVRIKWKIATTDAATEATPSEPVTNITPMFRPYNA